MFNSFCTKIQHGFNQYSLQRILFPEGPVVAWGDTKLTALKALCGYHNMLMVGLLQGMEGSLSHMLSCNRQNVWSSLDSTGLKIIVMMQLKKILIGYH